MSIRPLQRSGGRLAAAAVAAALVAGVLPAAAGAADRLARSASTTTGLTARTGGDVSTQAFSPAGCIGLSEAPWHGGQRWIFGRGGTYCNYSVARVMVDTTLYRSRWWGWERLSGGRRYRASAPNVFLRTAWYPCAGQHEYLVSSYHESLEGGRTYYGRTGARRTINCG